jgi:hypothetical protein
MNTQLGKTLLFIRINIEDTLAKSGDVITHRNSLDNALDAVNAALEDMKKIEEAEVLKTKWLRAKP